MKSQATTVKDYLASLPEERRVALEQVRKVILANLDPDYEECMLWGVAAYVVPHRVWPSGHHTDPDKPLMMCGVSSQKNDMVVYLTNVYGGGGGRGGDAALRAWFEQACAKAGKKLNMTGGCCLRFTKLEQLALDVLGEAVRRTPVQAYVAKHLELSAGGGKAAAGKKPKSDKSAKKTAKKAVAKRVKKTVAKKTAAKR